MNNLNFVKNHCSETKLRRKRRKYENIVAKDWGIKLSDSPTKVVMICNRGLVGGVDQEMVFDAFSIYGQIENIVMVPGKSYCFVVFREVTSSEEAFASANNKDIFRNVKSPIFLCFAEKVPEPENAQPNFNEKPPGLFILEDFISEEDEKELLRLFGDVMLPDDKTKSSTLKNRSVFHFGYEFKYAYNNVDVKEPIMEIPKEIDAVWDRFMRLSFKLNVPINFRPDQVTVNNYEPGQGIPAHVDTHSAFEDPIVSLSLQSSVVMEFKNLEGKCCSILLPARSLCIMSGESRYGWTHAIPSRKSDIVPSSNGGLALLFRRKRISLTFRKIKQADCDCDFPEFCDSKKRQQIADDSTGFSRVEDAMEEKNLAAKLEENYVHEVYRRICRHFSETRHKPWPNVVEFMKSFPAGSILVDVGCGNGKYFSGRSDSFEVGCDASLDLMSVCRERGFEGFSCNCLRVPLRDNAVDGCTSIAVVHHLVTEERREKAISEIIRILKPQGRALIYVWAKNQERLNKKSSYLKQGTRKESKTERVVLSDVRADLSLPVHTNRTNFVHNDLLVPWKLRTSNEKENEANRSTESVYLRYYHVFEDEELKDMCSKFENVQIINYYYDQGNWCIMLRKS